MKEDIQEKMQPGEMIICFDCGWRISLYSTPLSAIKETKEDRICSITDKEMCVVLSHQNVHGTISIFSASKMLGRYDRPQRKNSWDAIFELSSRESHVAYHIFTSKGSGWIHQNYLRRIDSPSSP